MTVNKVNSGKNSGIDFNLFKVGLKRESLKTESDKSIFDAIDTDKNGVIDEHEIQTFKNAVVGTKRTRNKYDTQTIRKEAGELAQVIHNQISGLSNKNNTKNRLRAITPENAAFVVSEYQKKYNVSLAKDIDDEWGLDVKTVKEFVCKNLVDQAKRLGIKGVYYNDYQKITDISTLEKWINNVSNKIINHMKNAVETYYATDTEEAERTQQAQAKKTAKTSASQIVDDLIKSTKGYNDIDKIKAAVARIDSPEELEEVNRLLALKGYPPTDKYSAIENFIYQEANHSAVHTYNSSDYLEQTVQNWIDNGTLTGQAANEAQARMACRVIFDGGDGFGTDCNKIKKGVRMIKCPKPTGNAEEDNKQAREVYKLVDEMISKHKTFYGLGSPSKNLVDYCEGEMWDSEVKYLKGILGENEAIAGKEKAQAVADLTQEAVEGAGTNIESLKQAIKAISTPEDRKAVEEKLKEYCQKKGIKPQIEGQSYLQAILYDECDTFLGISTDHKEIRKFNEMLIEQGAYTEEEIVNLRAEQAALQILEGNFNNIKDAMEQIKDPAVLKKLNELLKTKGYNSLDDFFKQKLDPTKQDLINAELASNKLLDDQKAADVAYRLIKNSGFDKRAMGIRAIRTEAQAALVDEKLKQEGSSLAQVMEQFNKEKAENKSKAEFFDGWVKLIPGFSAISEEISDAYNKNTDSSDNLYLEMKQPQYLTDEQKAAYQMTVNIMEQKLAQMEKDYQAALDSQGAVSWAVNSFCERYGIGTTREEIEARIEHDKETIRLLKQAAEGKLGKMANGSTVAVSFEEVFKERNADTNFDTAKVEKVQNQAQMLVAMNYAKTNIAVCWEELENGLNSSDTKRLTVAITDTLEKLSNMAGTQLLLADGYSVKNSVIVDSNGSPVSADKLKAMATQLKQNLSDISKELLGREIPLNTPSDKMNKLLEKAFDSKKEDFKQEFKDAFGADCPDEMVENYISTIETGKFVANIGVMIGAAVAAPFTGGGTLAVFFMVGASSLGLNALEHSTDADGWTNSEWTSDVSQAFWDGLLGAAGVKIGQMAAMFAKGGNTVIAQNKWLAKLPKKEAVKVLGKAKNIADAMSSKSGQIGKKVLLAQKTKLLQMFPKLNTQTAEKISVMLARAEACGFEVTSDSLQSLVQTYCMEGQFDEETFLTALIISVAANTAGHGIAAAGDIKKRKYEIAQALDRLNNQFNGKLTDKQLDNLIKLKKEMILNCPLNKYNGAIEKDMSTFLEAYRVKLLEAATDDLSGNSKLRKALKNEFGVDFTQVTKDANGQYLVKCEGLKSDGGVDLSMLDGKEMYLDIKNNVLNFRKTLRALSDDDWKPLLTDLKRNYYTKIEGLPNLNEGQKEFYKQRINSVDSDKSTTNRSNIFVSLEKIADEAAYVAKHPESLLDKEFKIKLNDKKLNDKEIDVSHVVLIETSKDSPTALYYNRDGDLVAEADIFDNGEISSSIEKPYSLNVFENQKKRGTNTKFNNYVYNEESKTYKFEKSSEDAKAKTGSERRSANDKNVKLPVKNLRSADLSSAGTEIRKQNLHDMLKSESINEDLKTIIEQVEKQKPPTYEAMCTALKKYLNQHSNLFEEYSDIDKLVLNFGMAKDGNVYIGINGMRTEGTDAVRLTLQQNIFQGYCAETTLRAEAGGNLRNCYVYDLDIKYEDGKWKVEQFPPCNTCYEAVTRYGWLHPEYD